MVPAVDGSELEAGYLLAAFLLLPAVCLCTERNCLCNNPNNNA
jgi:hypothetical protein